MDGRVARLHLERLAVLLGGGGVPPARDVDGGAAHGLLALEGARGARAHGLGGDRPRRHPDHVEDALAGRRVREELEGERLALGEELRGREARAGPEGGGRGQPGQSPRCFSSRSTAARSSGLNETRKGRGPSFLSTSTR